MTHECISLPIQLGSGCNCKYSIGPQTDHRPYLLQLFDQGRRELVKVGVEVRMRRKFKAPCNPGFGPV